MSIVGIIALLFTVASAVGYHRTEKDILRHRLLKIAFLITAIIASWLFMMKCYEVPIHNNHISYVLKHHASSDVHFTGNTFIDIIYDYNTYKGVKELTKWGVPKDTEPRIVVETCVKVENGKSTLNQDYGYLDNEMKWIDEGRQMVSGDSMYLSFMDSCGITPGTPNWLEGTFFILGIVGSNRQYFYPLIFHSSSEENTSWRNEYAYPRSIDPDSTEERTDSVWREFQWGRIIPMTRSVNSYGMVSYNYIPPTDSMIYHGTVLRRTDLRRPNAIFTAEDISRAVEVLWIDGLRRNGSEIDVQSLTFDYIGPTEFSDMYPEPDRREVSKITFTDREKLSYIVEHGLRFHVKFPDMENIQQMRMFVITLLLGGLLGLLAGLLHKMISRYWSEITHFFKRWFHLNRRRVMWICSALLALLIVYLILMAYVSHVDAFDLSEKSSFGVVQ